MVFVLDESGSIGPVNFGKMLDFVKSVVSAYDVASNRTRIGLLTYSESVTVHFYLNHYTSKSSVINAIDRIAYKVSSWGAWAPLKRLSSLVLISIRKFKMLLNL